MNEQEPTDIPGKWYPQAFAFEDVPACTKERVCAGAFVVKNLISRGDCEKLMEQLLQSGQAEPVGVYGYTAPDDGKGSLRATAWSSRLADEFWKRFASFFVGVRYMHDDTPTDWYAYADRKAYRHWKAISVSPLLRFMRYENGGEHFGHYDMAFDYGDGRRTLVSFVVYLNTVEKERGGCTRFLRDGQEHIPTRERNFTDWKHRASSEDVVASVRPVQGKVLFFDHRVCHDVDKYQGTSSRIIIRGDIVYRALENENANVEGCTGSHIQGSL